MVIVQSFTSTIRELYYLHLGLQDNRSRQTKNIICT